MNTVTNKPLATALTGSADRTDNWAEFVPELIYLEPSLVVVAEQPRSEGHAGETDDLVRSVGLVGFSLSVITVFRNPDGAWQLISGERRLRYALAVGLSRIPAFDLTPLPAERRHLAQGLENEARAALTPFERARFVLDRKRVADIIALCRALECPSLSLAPTRREREQQLAELQHEAAQRGIALRPPNVATWAAVEQELTLDERSRKRLVKLAGLAEDIASVLEPLRLPQDSLLELADWPGEGQLLVAQALAAMNEPPTKRALAAARAVAEQLEARVAELRLRGKRQRLDRLRDEGDYQHLLTYAGEIVLSEPSHERAVQESLETILAYLSGKYKGRHFGDEDWGADDGEDLPDAGEFTAIDEGDGDAEDAEDSDGAGDEAGDEYPEQRGTAGGASTAKRNHRDDEWQSMPASLGAAISANSAVVVEGLGELDAHIELAQNALMAVAAVVRDADEATRRHIEMKLSELALLIDKAVQSCFDVELKG